MDFANMSIWCWIIPLLVGVICGIVGYLWGKGSISPDTNAGEMQALIDANARLTVELDACREKLAASEATPPEEIPFDRAAARAAFGKTVRQDDLKIVDGIGPKIESLFHNFEIKTWKALSETPVARCQQVLDSGGDRYTVHDPASWPMQARMAYEGKWQELARWQKQHGHGKL